MWTQEEMRELEELEREPEPVPEEPRVRKRGMLLTAQLLLCVLLLLALAVLKAVEPDVFSRVRDWYRQESVRQIELPRLVSAMLPETAEGARGEGEPGALRQV